MFEDYLKDADHFIEKAQAAKEENAAKRDYRASVFYAMGAVEAFINYVGDTFAQGGDWPVHEIAFLNDKKFGIEGGHFVILDQAEYHKLEDKLKFLIMKFHPSFDFEHMSSWSQLLEMKRLRDAITHPRQDEDGIQINEYKRKVEDGLSAVIEIINILCKALFNKPLRKQLTDLKR